MNQFRTATALLHRRIRIDLRTAPGHLVRMFSVAFLALTIFASMEGSRLRGSPGLMAFRWAVWCDALLISAASIMVFASVIAAERENGTLGLLRMTGTSPLSLLLGQGVSGLVIGLFILAVQLPLIVLTITLGGVLWNQVLAAFLALGAHLVLCAGIGLLASTLAKRSGTAAFYTLLTQFGLWLGPLGLRWLASRMNAAGRISMTTEDAISAGTVWLDQHLAWSRLSEICTSLGATELISGQFWLSIGTGIVLIAVAAVAMDFRPVEVSPAAPLILTLWKSVQGRAWNRWAITGKDYRQFMGGRRGLVTRICIYSGLPFGTVWLMNRYGDARLDVEDGFQMMFWMGLVFLMVELNAIAARLFRNELAEQTWSTLFLLPRSMPSIMAAKLGGAILGILPAIVALAIAVCVSADVQRFFGEMSERSEAFLLIVLPSFWLASTCLCSMMLVSLPPTVIVFCGLLMFFLHYFITAMAAMTLNSRGTMSMTSFNYGYVSIAGSACMLFVALAVVRLRKLTAKD